MYSVNPELVIQLLNTGVLCGIFLKIGGFQERLKFLEKQFADWRTK